MNADVGKTLLKSYQNGHVSLATFRLEQVQIKSYTNLLDDGEQIEQEISFLTSMDSIQSRYFPKYHGCVYCKNELAIIIEHLPLSLENMVNTRFLPSITAKANMQFSTIKNFHLMKHFVQLLCV